MGRNFANHGANAVVHATNVRELAPAAFNSPNRFSVGDRLGIGCGDLLLAPLSASVRKPDTTSNAKSFYCGAAETNTDDDLIPACRRQGRRLVPNPCSGLRYLA